MKKIILLLCFQMAWSNVSFATITYVKANATGLNNGSSWANAFTSLDLLNTDLVDTLWVANGVYPTHAKRGWRVWSSAKWFGGFVGTETQLSQRNWSTFQTILDGHDSSCQVITVRGALGPTNQPIPNMVPLDIRLDGFKIMRGVDTNGTERLLAGGVVLENSVFPSDKIVIANCLFTQNHGGSGGAIERSFYGDVSISNCRFENNTAKYGGAIGGQDNSIGSFHSVDLSRHMISDCVFSNNKALYGGAIHSSRSSAWGPQNPFNYQLAYEMTDSTPTVITRCIFRGNVATVVGGAISDSIHSR